MRNILLLTLSIFIISTSFAQRSDWLKKIQHSNQFKVHELGDISNYKWSNHLERYRWKESNSVDEDGFIIPQNTRIKRFVESRQNRSTQAYGNWTPIGLESWTNGNTGYNPGNGRINAVTVDPNNSDIIFVCAASGGVWKSIDGGASWNTNTDAFPILGTSDVAIDPNNSNNVYLATGDRDALDTYGVGVYKSTDGGTSWSPSGLFNEFDSEALIINTLEINPDQSNIIFAGSKDGLYKSTDYGVNWYKVIENENIMEVKINSQNPNTVFAVSDRFFYRSHNGGETFEIITNGLQTSIGRIAMDITPADTAYVYLLVADAGNDFNGVFISSDGGSSFIKKYGIESKNLLSSSQDGSGDASQAWYDLAIAVSRTDKNRIYTGGVNIWTSSNGGTSWSNYTHWVYYSESSYSHADIHSLDIYGNTLYCGSDGGAFKNIDHSSWQNISVGLNISQIYKLSSSANGTRISTGCQDNGTNIKNNNDWKHVKGADGMYTIINPTNQNIVYLSSQNGYFYKSSSGGDNSSGIFSPDSYGESGNWVTPLSLCNSQTSTLAIGLSNIFISNNSGNSWNSISNFSDDQRFDVVSIAPSNPDYIYASKLDHTYFTWDGGDNWTEITYPGVDHIKDIVISETDPLNVYFLKSSSFIKVYHSIDGAISFSTVASNIFQTTGSAICIENNTENGIYVGAEFGVYYTNDQLNSWILYSDQLPNVKVTDLEIVNDKLRAATYGRGVWESDIYSISNSIKESKAFNRILIYPNPSEDYIKINTKHLTVTAIQIFNNSGILIKSYNSEQNSYNISNLVSGVYFIRIITSDNNVYMKQFIKN